ncbi:unnamed protein product [Closterium sp. NIES-53]
MAGLIGFARGTVVTLEDPNLRAEFRAETPTDYCNRARRILATIRVAGAQYSMASYVTHVMQGLPSNYNLLKQMSMAPSTRATLNEDTLTSYILQDEAMQEAEQSQELLAPVNYVAPMKQGGRPRQRGQSGGGGSSGWKPTKDADKRKSAKDNGRGGGSQRRECWLCGDPDHLSFKCPDHSDSDDDYTKGGRGRARRQGGVVLAGRCCGADRLAGAGGRRGLPGDGGSSAGKLGGRLGRWHCCSARGGREAGAHPRRALSPGHASEPAFSLLVSAPGDVLVRASYTGQVLCTDLRPYSVKSTTPTTEVVAMRAIVSVTKSTPDRLHARLADVGMNTIQSSAKHEVATGLDLKSASGADLPCVSCVGGKLARHTFPDQGSDADDVLAVVHVDLCGPFRVASKDGSQYFLLLKDRKTHYVWVRQVAKKSDVLQELV